MMSENIPIELEFITIPGGSHELGWRFSDRLSPEVIESITDFCQFDIFLERFSRQREVDIPTDDVSECFVEFMEGASVRPVIALDGNK